MMIQRAAGRTVLLAALLLLAACGLPGRAGDGANRVQLRVENNLIPPTSLTVFAVPEVGSRRMAGVVRPGETATLTFSAPVVEGYRFTAQTTAGREIVSNTVTLGPGRAAVWDVNANLVVPD
jgi:hypothetical protein